MVKPAPAQPGTYRNISGATALAWGLVAASERSGLRLFYASYPITPASELLHELSRLKNFGVITLQAEDEIAAANVALGAAFAGDLGVTGTSGPGMDLKAETLGLAVTLELPMVIVDVQRAGPSTGMPTKTEQADLLLAHVRAPRRVAAADRRGQVALALLRRRDRGRADRGEVPDAGDPALGHVPRELLRALAAPGRRHAADDRPGLRDGPNAGQEFLPYLRDENLARPWAIPGTKGLRHRIGGLEKEDGTGDISYDPENHERMTHLRAAKVAKVAEDIPLARGRRPRRRRGAPRARLGLDLRHDPGRGSAVREQGRKVATAHLRPPEPVPDEHRGGRARGTRRC